MDFEGLVTLTVPQGVTIMLHTLLGIILLMWVLGFATEVGGNLIHALLVIALVVFAVDLIAGRNVSV